MKNKEMFLEAVSGFIVTCQEIYTVYLDSTQGFNRNHQYGLDSEKSNLSKNTPYIVLAPKVFDVNEPIIHNSSLQDFINRNSINNLNYIKSAQFVIVTIYTYWEHEYREKIASSLCLVKNDVQLNIMGDVMLLRRDIIHHKGILTKETCKKLTHFKKSVGEEINLTFLDIYTIIERIKESLTAYALDQFEDDDFDFNIPTYVA